MACRQSLHRDLKDLSPFMLTSDLLSKSQHYLKGKRAEYVPKKISQPVSSFHTPRYTDKLFWCFYIIHKGVTEYRCIGQKVFSVETESKIGLVEVVRSRADLLKQHKISARATEAELVSSPRIGLATFRALCVIHDISCLVVKGRMCYEVNTGGGAAGGPPEVLMVGSADHSFALDMENNASKVQKYMDEYWVVASLEKPLLSVSSYKLGDLQGICSRMGIATTDGPKGKTKKELYQAIVAKI